MRGCVRVSCHTIALCTGRPVRRSQTIAVSRWFVTPMPARADAAVPARERHSWTTDSVLVQISIGSCSTHPARGKICSCSRWATETIAPPESNTMARVEVVPWSMART